MNSPNPTPRPMALPFLLTPSLLIDCPIKRTTSPLTAVVESNVTDTVLGRPHPRLFVPVIWLVTGVHAAIMVTPSTFMYWATIMLAEVLLLVTFSVKLTGTMLPDFSVVCAIMLIDEKRPRSKRNFLSMMVICD